MSTRGALALCLIGLVLTGCATRIRNIPTQALLKQTNGVAERDHRECEAAITGAVKGVWFPAELEFASCMIARNYQVYVQLLDASVEVRKVSPRVKIGSSQVLEHLMACERSASRNLTWAEKVGRPAVAVAGAFFWPVSVGGMAASATLAVNRQRDYADCMTPLGYVVTVWQPGPAEQPFKPATEERSGGS